MSKIALITGGSRGLGRNMALHLADKTRDIILTYHSRQDEAETVVRAIEAKGQKAVALQLDVAQSGGFADFARRVQVALRDNWRREDFDYLINNAGTGVFKDYMSTTEEEFDRMVNEHLRAPYFLSQTLLPLIKDGGRILNVSSGLTRMAFPGFSAYSIMKSAVETLSVYMAKELGARKIAVNTIAPGAIETDFGGGYVRDTPDVNRHLAEITALGRVACRTISAARWRRCSTTMLAGSMRSASRYPVGKDCEHGTSMQSARGPVLHLRQGEQRVRGYPLTRRRPASENCYCFEAVRRAAPE